MFLETHFKQTKEWHQSEPSNIHSENTFYQKYSTAQTTKRFMKNTGCSCLTTMSLQLASNGSKFFISALSSHRCFNSKAYCLMQVSRELLNSWISLSTVLEHEVRDAILVTAAIIHALVSGVTKVFFSRLWSFVKTTSGSTSVTRLEYSPNTYSQRTEKICI